MVNPSSFSQDFTFLSLAVESGEVSFSAVGDSYEKILQDSMDSQEDSLLNDENHEEDVEEDEQMEDEQDETEPSP